MKHDKLKFERERQALELLSVAGLSNDFIAKNTGLAKKRVAELRMGRFLVMNPGRRPQRTK